MAFLAFIVYMCAFALFEHTTALPMTEKSESLNDAVQTREVKLLLERMIKRSGTKVSSIFIENTLMIIYNILLRT